MTQEFAIELGLKIKEAREAKQITQVQLSKMLGYRSGQFVSLFERGLSPVPVPTIAVICDILGLNKKKIFNDMIQDYRNEMSKQFTA